jgi:hypothetical protein
MKTRMIFLIVCCLLVELALTANALASTTYAYAAIARTGDGAANNSDSDSAYGYCTSYACADCPANHAAWASTTATVNVAYGGTGMGFSRAISTSVTPSNSEPSQYSGHSFTNDGSAYFYDYNVKLIGQGLQATVKYNLSNLNIVLPVMGSRTNTLDFSINNNPLCAGSVTLTTSGTGQSDYSLTTNGWFVDSFFDVFFETSSQTWNANYIGLAFVETQIDVDSFFDISLEAGSTGDGVVGDLNLLETVLVIPEGYTYVPEPATIGLLGLGLALLRRKH